MLGWRSVDFGWWLVVGRFMVGWWAVRGLLVVSGLATDREKFARSSPDPTKQVEETDELR